MREKLYSIGSGGGGHISHAQQPRKIFDQSQRVIPCGRSIGDIDETALTNLAKNFVPRGRQNPLQSYRQSFER